jgi:lysine 2,3-aminomutase
VDATFTVRVTRSFAARMDMTNPDDPLARQVLPDALELEQHPGDVVDAVGDMAKSPVPWIVQKHPDRLILMVTKQCHLYCRYCFRRTHAPGEQLAPTPAELERAVDYVLSSGVEEVILSGGDPLTLRDDALFALIDRLQQRVPVVRIHTRAPITYPQRVTPALVAGLRERRPVWVVVHTNHAAELAPDVDQALARLVDAGLPVLNQSVLLRGVNDSVDALASLCRGLVRRGVFPYYLHQTDPVPGTAHLRVSVSEGLALMDGLRAVVSGVALPTFVVDPSDGSGKRPATPEHGALTGRGDAKAQPSDSGPV